MRVRLNLFLLMPIKDTLEGCSLQHIMSFQALINGHTLSQTGESFSASAFDVTCETSFSARHCLIINLHVS